MDEKLEHILEKTGELYKKYGLKSISMDDVASENGISKKTLYKYVSDKKDLILKILKYEATYILTGIEHIYKQELNALEEVFALRPIILEMMKKFNPVLEYDLKKYHPDIFKDLINIKARQIYNSNVKNLEKGIKEGVYRENLDADIIAKIRVVTELNRIESEDISFADLNEVEAFKQIAEYHLRAVCSPKGLLLLEQKLKEIE